ncbi:succinate--hydroxymethylglutarate CoA-transferase-like [Ornithodoros turicata]|uniref:succinate--hydroxymethylglutarate CoA-transferase-like n=1 Tax=Ornithodoros turicata TaxID=34597 RepID=UPI0031387461
MAVLLRDMRRRSLRILLRLPVDASERYKNGSYIAKLKHTSTGPLAGIRILDLTRILAGPFCSMILGDMGAEVIKIEKPGSGDETRNWGPPFIGDQSCYFLAINRNKKGIAVDLKRPEGVDVVKKLAETCDVFVENYMPGKLDSLGLGYEDIKAVAPNVVYCSISGYGSKGRYKDRAGYDVIAASMAGLLHITGPEGGDPCKVGVAMTDLATGLYAHGAILAALLQQKLTGTGQKIECNLFSSQVSLLVNVASNYLNAGIEGSRLGTSHESIVPYNAFQVSDGYLTVGAASNHQFAVLCKVLDLTELLSDSCFKDNESRVKNRKKLTNILQARFKTKTTSEWLELFEGCGIPYGPINSIEQVFNEPLAQDMVVKLQHKTAGEISLVGPAVAFSDASNTVRSPPPLLGEHTDQVLSSVLSLDQIRDLRTKKVIQ